MCAFVVLERQHISVVNYVSVVMEYVFIAQRGGYPNLIQNKRNVSLVLKGQYIPAQHIVLGYGQTNGQES